MSSATDPRTASAVTIPAQPVTGEGSAARRAFGLPVEDAAVSVRGVTKTYGDGEGAVVALNDVTVGMERGRFTAVMGPSGSGKSTLMHVSAGLDTVSSGTVHLGDTDLTTLNDKELTLIRRDRIGFVFQQFNLLPTLTAEENITLPARLAGRRTDPERLAQVVEVLGLQSRLQHRPAELSGGQQQRVAVARALVTSPDVVFADEPTGNLDSRSGADVLAFLRRSVDDMGQSLVMVTHDPGAASHADRVLFLADGSVVDELFEPTPEKVLDCLLVLER